MRHEWGRVKGGAFNPEKRLKLTGFRGLFYHAHIFFLNKEGRLTGHDDISKQGAIRNV